MTRINVWMLLCVSAASGFVAVPLPHAAAKATFVPAAVAMLSDATATAPPPTVSSNPAGPSVLRRVISLPVTVPRAIWRRCTVDECDVGRPRPLQFLKNLIPKSRPLNTIARAESSAGIYKVERRAGTRVMVLYPNPAQQRAVSTEDALEMF